MEEQNSINELMKNMAFSGMMDEESEILPIAADEEEDNLNNSDIPEEISILPLRNTVLFPGVIIPISVGRQKSLELVRDAYNAGDIIGAFTQFKQDVEDPGQEDIYRVGTIAKVVKIFEMPDGNTTVIIQGKKRCQLERIYTKAPYIKGKIEGIEDESPEENDSEFEAIVSSVKDLALQIVKLSPNIPDEASAAIKNIENYDFLVNFISSNTDISIENKQNLLLVPEVKKRANTLLEYLTTEVQKLELKHDIQSKVKSEMDQQQKEYLLNQQMKTIQNELGSDPTQLEIDELKKKAQEKKWSEEVDKAFHKEIEKLQRINPSSPEYSNQINYLQTLVDLPWNEYTEDNFDLARAKRILDEDHFGLENVKERILEHLAVLKLKGDMKAPILCLYGPPGVGKTSLGRSISRALNRSYTRMSLGGLHDEAEIRGHRKTYIGALPGRIIQNIKKVKSSNPVFILDEIDKVGNDFRGDPASALLEVLDPEQNSSFYDNYLELEYDLSKVMFITTANSIETIRPALRDRMELINVTGYIVEEKIEIAKRHLIPQQLKANGVKSNQLKFNKTVLEKIIENYTRESGVRELDKKIAKVVRHTAKKIGLGEAHNTNLKPEDIRNILGPEEYLKNEYQGNDYAGLVTGLAWTATGGQIMFIESSLSKGNGKLTLTGNLGTVMKESAQLALEYIKSHARELDIDDKAFNAWNIHLHVPEGAIPKDGPSAGITMVTSLASAFTQRKVKKHVAMTGEITLIGRVLPVGGIKEKILAAKRANIKEIILSRENKKDIEEIKDIYVKGLKFHYVDNIMEALDISLLKQKVPNSLKVKN